ncbi:MAG: transglutaminase family protein [Bacteroidia bacterium]
MAIRVALHHRTHYSFDRLVSLSPHVIRLRPAPHCRTPIKAYSLRISPENHFINWQQDPFGNYLARLVFPDKADHLFIDVEIIAEMVVINPFDFFLEPYADHYPFAYPAPLRKELAPYLEIAEDGPYLQAFLATIDRQEQRTIDFLVQVNQRVNQTLGYEIRLDAGVQTPDFTLERGTGSCRDFTWLMVQAFRHLGLAARFVSGYSVQLKADEKPLEGPAGVAEDVTDLHAWVEVYVPGAGWIGLDGTSGLLATEGHIPLACTPDYRSAAPVVGFTDMCEVSFDFANTVARIHEDPRVTKPFADSQWEAIERLGHRVDADLLAGDVRLTMGGEPTFVSIDDMESPEWNTAADGPHKRARAWDLAQRLRDTFGPGGLLHYGQGKWYPGEPIPRWAYGIHWRKDGVPVWKDSSLLASPLDTTTFGPEDAQRFATALARQLGLRERYVMPAYEDIFYMLWEEGQLPVDSDPLTAKLDDPIERRSLAQIFDRGLGQPVGYVLPVEWDFVSGGWRSSIWPLRREHLYLIPGNSAMGLRLPLKTLPAVGAEQHEQVRERSLFEDLPALETYSGAAHAAPEQTWVVRTALCVEVREGRLHVFFPPLAFAEHYLELVATVEAVAAALAIPVLIEGYEPPRDYRMERIVVAPDPGVIEVNIHPATTWDQLVDQTQKLYEQARLARLGTEKFMLDGRHTGTGGGNHITLGAARPADSPLLRRPDLLQSLITYWQHHPSLSYLFSSAFIGPTSQSPRIDEGREDRLYEVELAFSQVPLGKEVPYWLVDRVFRHLLTDITGNTHRSEFCIDKLYSPDSASGRLGILEMRGFDMPPHSRMSLLQMLLVRALIAWFWREPYQHKLVRWGASLHDKYLLPHYSRADMAQVVSDLRGAGYDFHLGWFDSFFEFRFPHYGTVQIGDISIELRMGIEPWHVLGEEMANTGTARFVDSSLERVQVKLRGVTDGRYVLLCNGCRVPLWATGVHGEYVAGIRYRAWQPPSALHPTIGIDAPLVFDLVDTWNKRAIGGCTYHVSHPGGLSYETFPVNAFESESRRENRFRDIGFTPAAVQYGSVVASTVTLVEREAGGEGLPVEIPEERIIPETPYTLDLRLFKGAARQ